MQTGSAKDNSKDRELFLSNFDYLVPEELVAQNPLPARDQSRMMVVHRKTGKIEHKRFLDLVDYLEPQDLVIFNKTKVFKSRLIGERAGTGGKVELFLLKQISENCFHCLLKSTAAKKVGLEVNFSNGLKGKVESEASDPMIFVVSFHCNGSLHDAISEVGRVPLPPYIHRDPVNEDLHRYQTVYAEQVGSVAAPTAGLHFTEETFEKMREKGLRIREVVLHVGLGTFLPIKVENLADHKMHEEEFFLEEKAKHEIVETKKNSGRVVAVGTTTVRTLESSARGFEGKTNLFLKPGETFQAVDVIFTNFHQPKSSLIVMIAAFMNSDSLWREAYQKAVEEKYRFFSYGDCMLIL
jgi:S-adenosylmethionine:tRNA ribosyltransferase-isomerase